MDSVEVSEEFEQVSGFKCPHCQFVGLVKTAVHEHLRKDHSNISTCNGALRDESPIHSSECGKSQIDARKTCENHIFNNAENHITTNGFSCSFSSCSAHFELESNAVYHLKCHFESKFKCPECGEINVSWKAMASHLWKMHAMNLELLSCHLCDYRTGKKELLKFHLKTHSDQHTCLCDECGKGFKNMKQLRNHKELHAMDKASPEQQNKNKCSECGKILSSGRLLRAHRNAIHLKIRTHLCNYCGYNTTSQSNLRVHLRQHTKDKPFTCEECDYRTADHNSLRRHKMKHTGERPYKCPLCDYSSIQSSTYKTHLRNKHDGLTAEFIFSCELCNFRTIRKEQLSLHTVSNHTPESSKEGND